MTVSQWHELQYLPSLSIPNAASIFENWKQRSALTQARHAHQSDIRYGAHPREVMDFYPAAQARGCVIYIHGGYWRAFSKFETSFVVEGFLRQGLSVALINYPLCPEVRIADIRRSCVAALVHLCRDVLSMRESHSIVATGHSAGGHLVGHWLTEDWAAHGLPQNPIVGVVSLSGVFDVAPLMQTSLNSALQIDARQAAALNLNSTAPRGQAKLVLAVGAQESDEFHRQSVDLAKTWHGFSPHVVEVADANHFTIVDSLAEPGGVLNRLAIDMAGR